MELSIKTSASLLLSILSCSIIFSGASIWSDINRESMQEATKGFDAKRVSINDAIVGKSFPTIIVENQRIKQHEEFQPLSYVQASDVYDGDLSEQVNAYGNVDAALKGEYEVRYVIANSYGLKSEKKIKVLVD